MKRALIVASGLRGITGHNYSYTLAVQEELERRGFEVTVFVNKNAPADLVERTGFKPVFSLGTYDFIPLNGPLPDLTYTHLQSRIYAYDLRAAMRQAGGDYDLIFCHTVADFELIGWNHYLRKNKPRGHLFMMQRNTPRFLTIPKWKRLLHPYWRIRPRYLKALYRKMKGRFVLMTDSEILTEDYKNIYPHRVVTAPVPLKGFEPQGGGGGGGRPDFSPGSVLARYGLRNEGLYFGFMGDSRNHKGFSLLAPAIEKVLAREKEKINFVVQCPNSEYENANTPSGLNELRGVARAHPDRLTLIYERLSDEDYLSLFRSLGAVMIPYTHPQFTEGTSNVFTEAVALGKPVVVSDDTWMSSELRKYGGGLEFEKENVEEFAAKILELTADYETHARRAENYSPVWRNFHNAENLINIILRECRIESPLAATTAEAVSR